MQMERNMRTGYQRLGSVKLKAQMGKYASGRYWRLESVAVISFSVIFTAVFLVQITGAASVSVEPSYQKAPPGEMFNINITIDPMGEEVYGAQYELYFNTSILNATVQTPGTFLSQDGGSTVVVTNRTDNAVGKIEYGETRIGEEKGVTTRGTLSSITFKVIADAGMSTFNLVNVTLGDPLSNEIPTAVKDGMMEIGDPLPYLIIHTLSNSTISPNGDDILDSTEINVKFSEFVATNISIEDPNHNMIRELYRNDSVMNPEPLVWYGDYTNGTVVKDGIYYVNVTMDDRVNPPIYSTTMAIIIDTTPPTHTNESPFFTSDVTPLISVDLTDPSDVNISSIKLYVEDVHVFSKKTRITNGYTISYQTEYPYHNGSLIPVRIVARDTVNNKLEYTWNFVIDLETPEHSNETPYGITDDPTPTIMVEVTDEHGIEEESIKLYVKDYHAVVDKEKIHDGYRVSYRTEYPYQEGELVSVRIIANDTVNNTLDFTWNFSIAITLPTVVNCSPIGSVIPVKPIMLIRVTFSEEMNRTSVEDAFSIVPVVNGSFRWSTTTMEFIPDYLEYGKRYNITIKGDAKDSVGNYLDGNGNGIAEGSPSDDFSWYFTTTNLFDTGKGTYPSISGTHKGTITPNKDILVDHIYTYPCKGTGGHTEYAMIWNGSDCAVANWDGYQGDYHNISFNRTLTLKGGVVYNYTIRTGSYPQIHHTPALPTANGWINCTKFTDANGREYNNWIPAIKLFYEE